MIGLLKKDALVMRKVLKSYLLILAVMLALSALSIYTMSFVTSFVSVMVMMLPVSAFSYDEQAKWDGYAAALPLGRRAIVGARYLYVLLLVVCVGTLGAALVAVQGILDRADLAEGLVTLLSALGVAMLIVDIMLPLNYKLGPERARPWLYAVVFIPLVLFMGAWKLGLLDSLDLGWLVALPDDAVLWGFALVPVAGLAGMGISFLISCRIMERKEF